MKYREDPDKGDKVQMENAPFWCAYNGSAWYYKPIDNHAVYGSPILADRDKDEIDVSVREGYTSLVTAIRAVHSGDEVRVNDGNWMDVIEPDDGFVDEGFACEYKNGHVTYCVRVRNSLNNPPGTFNSPWMRRWDNYTSQGEVHCLEVKWKERGKDDD
jgi:hypothetical protein